MAEDFLTLQDRVLYIFDANPLQSDADVSQGNVKWALNESYRDEINLAKTECNLLFFYRTYNFTWPRSQNEYVLTGTPLEWMDLYLFQDVTSGENRPQEIQPFWRDANTLTWGRRDGPSSDRNIRTTYVANAEELKGDGQQPALIGPAYRHLLSWSAAILLREIAEEQAPQSWERRRDKLRFGWWSALESRPRSDVARVQPQGLTDGLDRGRSNYFNYGV